MPVMKNCEIVKNSDLLGNNFHTVIERYSPKYENIKTSFGKNEI